MTGEVWTMAGCAETRGAGAKVTLGGRLGAVGFQIGSGTEVHAASRANEAARPGNSEHLRQAKMTAVDVKKDLSMAVIFFRN